MASIDTSITNYFAIPVKRIGAPDPTLIEKCAYFDRNWQPVGSKDLYDTEHQNSVCLRQCGIRLIPEKALSEIASAGFEVNNDVTLFAATAKTLGGSGGMPNQFLAREESVALVNGDSAAAWSVTIPLAPNTRRGVILVFQFLAQGSIPQQLIATADPEVGNGSSN